MEIVSEIDLSNIKEDETADEKAGEKIFEIEHRVSVDPLASRSWLIILAVFLIPFVGLGGYLLGNSRVKVKEKVILPFLTTPAPINSAVSEKKPPENEFSQITGARYGYVFPYPKNLTVSNIGGGGQSGVLEAFLITDFAKTPYFKLQVLDKKWNDLAVSLADSKPEVEKITMEEGQEITIFGLPPVKHADGRVWKEWLLPLSNGRNILSISSNPEKIEDNAVRGLFSKTKL